MSDADEDRATPPGYAERMDPGGEVGQAIEGLAALDSPLGRLLLGGSVPQSALADVRELERQYTELTRVDWIADALSPLGWVLFGGAPAEEYRAAATLAQEGKPDQAEALLVEKWNEDNLMKWPLHRVCQLYVGEPERGALGVQRQRLLFKALDHHRAGAYEASIPIVLAQMDGICADLTGREGGNFFCKDANDYVTDEVTLAGHPAGLPVLSRLFRKTSMKTQASGALGRHSVLHGRELAYDTRANSTKCFVALFTVIEWGQALAKARLQTELEERTRRYAGDPGVDEHGRRLDRRTFDEAKKLLIHAHALQGAHYRKHRRYTPDRALLDPLLTLDNFERVEGYPSLCLHLAIADDGQQHHAWVETVTGFVLGIGDRDGEWLRWTYAEENPPTGGLGSGADWRHPSKDPAHPDW